MINLIARNEIQSLNDFRFIFNKA